MEVTDATLSQIARKMAERIVTVARNGYPKQWFVSVFGLVYMSCPEDEEAMQDEAEILRQAAIPFVQEAMLLALQKAEQRIEGMLSGPRPYDFTQIVELAIKAAAAEVTALKSELIPSTSPDEQTQPSAHK